ncbi:thiosulfate sulfurtransferase GlpE [Thorsellia kenyensis]|uniref:Thiosulfate sulfurtransferase GlpE n=1 Tax=Thorsellia kenyensis TaxID=1549888 RepID=A0ABV6C8U0_9GAMM
MSELKQINTETARELLKEDAILFDIRDINSFIHYHHPKAIHLTSENIQEQANLLEFDKTILIVCYHGISSQSVAQWFINEGFKDVYSVDGGMTAWKDRYNEDCIEGI